VNPVTPLLSEPSAAACAALLPLRVLVIDDDPGVLSLIHDLLIEDGHQVETLDDGHQVLARLAAASFDVVLSDMRMPTMSGPVLHAALEAAHPELARRMVFMSGDTLADGAEEFLSRVGAPTLAKPFTRDALLGALRAAMNGDRVSAK
jgi:DNA-binding NtrC family response regulator